MVERGKEVYIQIEWGARKERIEREKRVQNETDK